MPPKKSTSKKVTAKRVVKRRSATSKMRGGSASTVLSGLHNFVRDNQLLSKGIAALGQPGIASVVAKTGYGRKKRTSRRKPAAQRGGGLFTDLGTGIHALFGSGTKKKRAQKGRGLFTDLGTGIHALFGSGVPRSATSRRSAIHI